MSKFYTQIANHYDDIFPTGEPQLALIAESAGKPPKDILDAACGSGGYSKRLADMGYAVTAVDLDEKMVQFTKARDERIHAQVLNMLQIQDIPQAFDLILCIGNSLVHLHDLQEIGLFLRGCRSKLRPGGRLLVQIVNYDRVLDQGITSLPTIKNREKDLTFERYYRYLPEQHAIDFMTVLTVKGETMENHERLFPVRSGELKQLLEASGFSSIHFYGSFNKDRYEPMESFPLVIVAE